MKLLQQLSKIKQNNCDKVYEKKVQELTDSYTMWIQTQENKPSQRVLPNEMQKDWQLICVQTGEVLLPSIASYQKLVTDQTGLIYADEDLIATNGKRYAHFMKPDFSPDTLESFFYFGSFLWLNKKLMRQFINQKNQKQPNFMLQSGTEVDRASLYEFVLHYTAWLTANKYEIVHVPEVLFHGEGGAHECEEPMKPEVISKKAYWGYEEGYDSIKDSWRKKWRLADKKAEVSVIIPSKDHPEILRNCIESLVKYDAEHISEIVIVDNGSSEENKRAVENLLQNCKITTIYCYEQEVFNFSCMCNRGAKEAHGNVYLFLNDDIELKESIVSQMLASANQKHVGAVGAKLLYPKSDVIQHVGVTNLDLTPEHKLMGQSDATDCYYGRNRLRYDVLAVTAACLMVEKEKFEFAGGFDESFAVSYNDVDFCFSLFEKGYFNVCDASVSLYHHESLSRGADVLDAGKWLRQMKERDKLYAKHEKLRGVDPFYNPNLSGQDYRYFCAYTYPFARRNQYSACLSQLTVDNLESNFAKNNNDCLKITIDSVYVQKPILIDEEQECLCINGWAYVMGMDNARYEKNVIVKVDTKVFVFDVMEQYREDVAVILPDETNVGLSGFMVRIPKDVIGVNAMQSFIDSGVQFAMIWKDKCSRQRLFHTV